MDIGSRILELRKHEGLNQADFGKRIGVTRSAICNYENGGRPVGKQMIISICSVFGVNEKWLRTGEGEMFDQREKISVERLCAELHASELETEIVRAYFRIDPKVREQIMRQLIQEIQAGLPAAPESAQQEESPQAQARAAAEDVYQQVLEEKEAVDESSASPSDTGKMA